MTALLSLSLCLLLSANAGPSYSAGSASTALISSLQSQHNVNSDERWLEVVELYTLPFDPLWRKTALRPLEESGAFGKFFPTASRELNERRAAIGRRVSQAKSDDQERIKKQGDAELARKRQKYIDTLAASADRTTPITVMRAWDGISQAEVLVTFGQGQRGTLERFRPKKPVLALIGVAAPGEDWQAGRTTVREIRSTAKAPTDFAPAEDSPSNLRDLAFGEVRANALSSKFVIPAQKDPTPGSGIITLSMQLPVADVPIDQRFPWFVEFQLFELEKDGSRGNEVKFEGPSAVVALRTAEDRNPIVAEEQGTAYGRVLVKSPKPWGYEAVATRWWGVAPKGSLIPASNPKSINSPASQPEGTPSLEEPMVPALPAEPTTPEVPTLP